MGRKRTRTTRCRFNMRPTFDCYSDRLELRFLETRGDRDDVAVVVIVNWYSWYDLCRTIHAAWRTRVRELQRQLRFGSRELAGCGADLEYGAKLAWENELDELSKLGDPPR